ncbi:glycogen debranching N-terminal domain-containing protein [Intrasporangium sp. DVR]|uniref:glycogen debranching N-terminal domain-containing protein n=1 Tax=Intrasporangium sp. DVR TaxID=3127867 RepID=UPI00313A5BFC
MSAQTPSPHRQPWLHDLAICVDGNGTALSAWDGSMSGTGAEGFFVDDQRVVSRFSVALGASDLVDVAHASRGGRSDFFLSARGLGDRGPDPTVEVHRRRQVVGGTLTERLTVVSRAARPVIADLVVTLGGDGADISAVKAGVTSGQPVEVTIEGGRNSSAAPAASWTTDRLATRVRFSTAPAALETTSEGLVASFPVALDSGGSLEVGVFVTTERRGGTRFAADAGSRAVRWATSVEVSATDPRIGRLVTASLTDLQSLLLSDPEDAADVFAAAGTPWYLTLFGRDSIWAARMTLPLGTTLAGGTLRALARRQGTKVDVKTAEAPGKIPHELRRTAYADPAVGFALPPVYYGTVDATALWMCLLHDAWRWGMREDEVRALLPSLRAAAAWLAGAASPEGDGLIKYVDESGHGLINQGWKDSGDSMRFRDGSIAAAPIALVEAQAYAVEAAAGAAALLRALGTEDRDRALADALETWSVSLAGRIRDHFWVGEPGHRYLAMAIDGEGRAVDGIGSNMGHVLGTGALAAGEAAIVTATLTGQTMLGRFGIATMATDNGGFNPIGYHTGSVWVHDSAICALGMAREGHTAEGATVVSRLLDLGEAFDYRMPELFSDAGALDRPAPYPASCRPQAWAAASAVAMLTVALGLTVNVPARKVSVHPAKPLPFGAMTVRGIRVGDAELTVIVDGAGGVEVAGLPEGFTLAR